MLTLFIGNWHFIKKHKRIFVLASHKRKALAKLTALCGPVIYSYKFKGLSCMQRVTWGADYYGTDDKDLPSTGLVTDNPYYTDYYIGWVFGIRLGVGFGNGEEYDRDVYG